MPTPGIRTRLVQMEVKPGRPDENTARMLAEVGAARADGAALVVFPEMAIPGYLLGDEWEHEAFLRECERCADELRADSDGITLVFGSVGLDWTRRNEDGRVRKYNALFVARDGAFIGPRNGPYPFVVKTLMPNYREFDDSRHFYDLRKLASEENRALADLVTPVEAGGLRLGCLLCEDAWDTDYGVSPLDLLARRPVDLYLNISASPYTFNKNLKRRRLFPERAARLGRPLVYVNNVGIQNNGKTVFTFDGASCVYGSGGRGAVCGAPFEDVARTFDIPLEPGARLGEPLAIEEDAIGSIGAALAYGTRKFMELCGVRRVTVGISGGVDSAVVAALYRTLLAPEHLLLVNMPGEFTSPTTRRLARTLAERLGGFYAEVPILDGVEATRRQMGRVTVQSLDGKLRQELRLTDFMLENVQARDRSSRILAALSSAFGGVFTCNANKSEMTVGYTTLYGDLGGYLANIADLWKTEVYALARHLNENVFGRETIPQGTFDLMPSAELSPAQNVDEKKGDPLIYPYHDALFRSWVESWNRATPEDILAWYRAGVLEEKLSYAGRISDLFAGPAEFVADLERWWNQYQGMGVAKRIQAPPVLAVKRRAFGFDHRESQMGAWYTRRYRELKRTLAPGG